MKNVKSFGKKLWEENVLKKAERARRRKDTIHKRKSLCNKLLNESRYMNPSIGVKCVFNVEENTYEVLNYIVYSGIENRKR